MNTQRTGGMTAIGILNIIFGSLGTLGGLLMILGGGLLAAGGSAMEAEMGAEAEGMGTMAAAGGAFVAIIGLVAVVAWGLLFISGIGVLKLAPWGRKLAMGCGGALVILNIISMAAGGFGFVAFGMMCYGGVLVFLGMQEDWKNAFSGDGVADALPPGHIVMDDEMKTAA